MVTIGANFHYEGLLPAEFDESGPVGDMIMQGYAERSPDGVEHFGDVYERMLTMMTTEPTLTASDLGTITAPTLVMAGDDDLMRPDHTCGRCTKRCRRVNWRSCPERRTSCPSSAWPRWPGSSGTSSPQTSHRRR